MELEEIKEQYAVEHYYKDWEHFINDQPNWKVETIMDDIAQRYYESKAKDLLNRAVNNPDAKVTSEIWRGKIIEFIDKESITNTPLN